MELPVDDDICNLQINEPTKGPTSPLQADSCGGVHDGLPDDSVEIVMEEAAEEVAELGVDGDESEAEAEADEEALSSESDSGDVENETKQEEFELLPAFMPRVQRVRMVRAEAASLNPSARITASSRFLDYVDKSVGVFAAFLLDAANEAMEKDKRVIITERDVINGLALRGLPNVFVGTSE